MSNDVSREIDQLLRERDRYEAWLRRLEAEKAGSTERAYARVRADYQRRFEEVVGKLQAHTAAVQHRLRQMEQQIADLENQRMARSEELDEARLRRSVGEYRDDNQWTELEGRLLGSVQQTQMELENAQVQIDRLREISAHFQRAEERPAVEPQPVSQPAPAVGGAAAVAPQQDLAPTEQPQPQPAAPQPPPPPPQPAPAAPPPVTEPVAASPEVGPEGEEGFLSLEELVLEDKEPEEFGIGVAPAAAAPEPPLGASAEPAAAEAGVGDELAFLESLSLGGGEEQTDSFSFLEQRGSGTPQTIICPHCSAANDPAEWYCTECGEELPAE